MKKIAILGSTGSIGTQTLEIVRTNGDLEVTALAAGNNIDLLEKQIQFPGHTQKTGSAFFRGNRAGGAAEIQIYRIISEGGELTGDGKEFICLICEDLRNDRHPLIMLRQNLVPLPAVQPAAGDEGGEIFIKSSEIFLVGASENISGKSLHGGKIILHGMISFPVRKKWF